MPAHAASIALATAYQESKLYNLEHGDRDSVGLFQQRPSQGWGTPEEILDPEHSINAFYDALPRVDGYETMAITVAAQPVQRSAFPEAYADHEADARALASALTGNHEAAFWCETPGDAEEDSDRLDDAGLVRRAAAVRQELEAVFGPLPLGGFQPGGVSSGHMEGSAHYEGRALDVFVRPVSAANTKRGWAIAHYLVAQADRLSINTVIFDDRIWRPGRAATTGGPTTTCRPPPAATGRSSSTGTTCTSTSPTDRGAVAPIDRRRRVAGLPWRDPVPRPARRRT